MMEYPDKSDVWEKVDANRSAMEWFSVQCFNRFHIVALNPYQVSAEQPVYLATMIFPETTQCFQNRFVVTSFSVRLRSAIDKAV